MNKKFWLPLMMAMPLMMRQGAGEGGGGGGGDASAGGEGQAAPLSALGQAAADAAAAKIGIDPNAAAQSGAEAQSGDGEQKSGEGQEAAAFNPDDFAVDLGEGFENYKDQAGAYADAAKGYLKGIEDPVAQRAAADALAWAAKDYQATAVTAAGTSAHEEVITMVRGWEKDAKTDPEIGGANYDKTVSQAYEGAMTFGGQKFLDLLDHSGLGSHPEVLRTLAKVGRMAKESDILAAGEGEKAKPVSFASALYA